MTNALRLDGVTLPGTGYPKKKNFVVPNFPVTSGLLGLFVIGGNQSLSLINHADSDAPALVVGSPTFNELGATLSQVNCLDTQLPSTSAMTIISVAKVILPAGASPFADSAMICSNFLGGGSNTGDSLSLRNATGAKVSALVQTSGGINASNQDISTGTAGQWNAFVGRYKSTGEAKAWWSHSGTVVSAAESAAATRVAISSALRIGGHYQPAQYTGPIEVQMVAIFNQALADADVASNLAYLTATYGPAIGVSTL
ncbi:MAG: hypothetical protein K0R58_230 [Ramlibacter sp.]|jgi:hypothetical protein|nr:hypothetical protein [Ramlibacter sp.]